MTPARLMTIPQAAEALGVIYFIRTRKAIKIGYATDLKKRLTQLQVGNSNPLKVMLTVPGTKEDEALLHHLLREHRIRGEWFKPSPFVTWMIGLTEMRGQVAGLREYLEERIEYLENNKPPEGWVIPKVIVG